MEREIEHSLQERTESRVQNFLAIPKADAPADYPVFFIGQIEGSPYGTGRSIQRLDMTAEEARKLVEL